MADFTIAERQRRYLENCKKRGLVHYCVWVSPEEKEALAALLEKLRKKKTKTKPGPAQKN